MKIKYILEDILSIKYTIMTIFAGFIPIKTIRKKVKLNITNNKNKNKRDKIAKRLNCKIGEFSHCDKSLYVGCNETTIGKYCSIGRNVAISPGSHPINFLSTSPYFYCSFLGWRKENEYNNISTPSHIGNDVWIGHGAFIKDGVKVSDGAIIAAGAVVVKDVPPYAIVGGVPAKIIKYRFDEQTIIKLLRLKWWDMDNKIIKKCPYKDINQAINYLEKYKNNGKDNV